MYVEVTEEQKLIGCIKLACASNKKRLIKNVREKINHLIIFYLTHTHIHTHQRLSMP